MSTLDNKDLKRIIDSAPAVTYVIKAYGDFCAKFVSTNVFDFCGYSERECLDNPNFWADCLHPHDKAEVLESFQNIFKVGSHRHEYRFRKKDGTYIWVLDELTLFRDQNDEPYEIIGSWLDISKQKELEAALIKSEARLRKLDQLKSNFISMAAHEINTPLACIAGYSEILSNDEVNVTLSEDQKKNYLLEIIENCEALSSKVDNLLDVGRIESGKKLLLSKHRVELVDFMSKLTNRFRLISTHAISLEIENSSPEFVHVDPHRMTQLFENILGNAIKYSPPNSEIAIAARGDGDGFSICFSDQGIGMTPYEASRIFDKFYRADDSDTAAAGFGLGMSIVKEIVDEHGGEIIVDSTPNRGTSVTVTMPVA